MQIKVRLHSRPIQRWARLFSKQTLFRAARMMGPTLVALSFAGVAHAQGTMDFSGAQTLMGTFNWRNDYAGIEQWSRFIGEENYCFHTQLHAQHESFAKTWDNNLRQQGFAAVFTDKCIVG
jgi:hypothetical protein